MAGAGEVMALLRISASDFTAGAFESATKNTQKLGRATKSNFKDMKGAALSYGKLVGSIVSAKVLSRGMAYLEQSIADVTRNIVDMDQSLTSASAKFGPGVERGTDAFREMEQVVTKLGGATEFTSSEIGAGLDFLAMAGFDYQQSLKALPPLVDLATASQTDFATASDIASDALGAFSLSTSPENIEKNLNRINDVFAETVTSSNVTMQNLFDTMKMAGPIVLEGEAMFATLTGTLGSAGIKGTIAATTLKNMYTRLQAPPSEAKKAIKKLKIEIDDGTGSMDNMINIIGKLNKALAGRTEIQRSKFLKDMFGQRAIAGVNILLEKGSDELQKYYNRIDRSTGAAARMADQMRGGLGSQIKILQSAIMGKGMDIFNQLMGGRDPAEAVGEIVDAIRDFDVTPIANGLREIGGYIKTTAELLWDNRDAIAAIARIWLVTNITGKVTGFVGAMGNMALSFTGFAGDVDTASKSMGQLGTISKTSMQTLRALGPFMTVMAAEVALALELHRAMEDAVNKQAARENRFINLSQGKGAKGQELTYKDIQKEMAFVEDEWRKGAYNRAATGAGEFKLGEGDISKSTNIAIKQEAYRRLVKMKGEYEKQWAENVSIKNRMFGGEEFGVEYSEQGDEFFKGRGWGMSSAEMARRRGEGISGQTIEQYFQPQEQKFTVDVQVNNAPPGTTATAEIKKIESMTDKQLGVSNG